MLPRACFTRFYRNQPDLGQAENAFNPHPGTSRLMGWTSSSGGGGCFISNHVFKSSYVPSGLEGTQGWQKEPQLCLASGLALPTRVLTLVFCPFWVHQCIWCFPIPRDRNSWQGFSQGVFIGSSDAAGRSGGSWSCSASPLTCQLLLGEQEVGAGWGGRWGDSHPCQAVGWAAFLGGWGS